MKVMLMPSPVSSGSVGTVTKVLGLAHQLVARGCEVCVVMGGAVNHLIRQQGFTLFDCPQPQPLRRQQAIKNMVDVLDWTGLAEPTYVQRLVKTEIAAIEQFRPHVIFAEARPTAVIAAEATQTPLVTIASWPMHPDFPANQVAHDEQLAPFNRQLQKYGLAKAAHCAELLFLRSQAQISPSLPQLEPELAATGAVRFVGYMLDESEQQLADDLQQFVRERPLIFVYLSVSAITPAVYMRTVPEAFAHLPFNVLCGCGFHFALEEHSLPHQIGNVRLERFVPAQAIMPNTSCIIFHGGQDTMLTTLRHGLPSLTITGQHFERQYNARQLAAQGASQNLPLLAFRPRRLGQAVTDLLAGDYAAKSHELAACLRRYGGMAQAADLIVNAAQKKPVSA